MISIKWQGTVQPYISLLTEHHVFLILQRYYAGGAGSLTISFGNFLTVSSLGSFLHLCNKMRRVREGPSCKDFPENTCIFEVGGLSLVEVEFGLSFVNDRGGGCSHL